jgi:iron complex outermembrane receptor protein
MHKRVTLAMMAGTIALGAAKPAWSQTQVSAPALEEIVVTARKTSERLQDVPVAVTAFSAEEMAARSIQSLTDIAALTPGLNFEDYLGGFGTPVIRGAAQARITDLDQNVSTFFDGIYMPRQYLINTGVVGLERVEIVKGPQSALYGRNAFMGAINYVTRAPSSEWRASVEGTLGGHERRDASGELSGPLLPGLLNFRIGGAYSEFDGDIGNGHPNAGLDIEPGSPGRLGGWERSAVQARLSWTPLESLEIDAGAYRFRDFEESRALIRVQSSTGDANCSRTLAGNRLALYCGELPFQFTPQAGSAAPRADVVLDPRGYGMDLETDLQRLHVEWRASDRLEFTYEYGKLNSRVQSASTSDRDPFVGTANIFNPAGPFGTQVQATPNGDVNYRSKELRVEFTPSDSLQLLVGAFDSTLRDFDRFAFLPSIPLLGTAPIPGTLLTIAQGRTTVDADAAFARIDWKPTPRLRLGLEARYAEETKRLVSGPSAFSTAVRTLAGEWKQWTPRATIDFRLAETSLLYLTGAKGVKSGGFNLSALVAEQLTYDEDENWTYELGSKSTFLDGRLRLNGAVFVTDWKNQQVNCSALGSPPGLTAPAVICNLGKASVRGLEVEGAYALTDALQVTFGASYNEATYGSGVVSDRTRVWRFCDDIVCPRSGEIGGNELARQSPLQGLLGLQYSGSINARLGFFAAGDVSYKAKQWADELNLAYVPARTLANARVGLRGQSWEVSLWSKNLLDEKFAASAFSIFSATDVQYVPIWGQRRIFGVTARYDF